MVPRAPIAVALAAASLAAAAPGAVAQVPSGRTAYRTADAFGSDLGALVARHRGLARRIVLSPRTVQGRRIEAVELASAVARTDDGRPTFALVALQHAREWPAGEVALEWATELATARAGDPRVAALLDRVRILVVPVANPDGFAAARAVGPGPHDDDPERTQADAQANRGAYRRKNCRAAAGEERLSCPGRSGVDLNRNAGAYWGGAGASTDRHREDFRGARPWSEPESRALRRLLAGRALTGLVALHTYSSAGEVLRQPGFTALGRSFPEEARLASLGDAMAQAAGYRSAPGWRLGQITGALDDWAYLSLGAPAYTLELRGPNFHGTYAGAVGAEYPGVRAALLLAAEAAAARSGHAVLRGTAPAGRVLRVRRAFLTPTSRVRDTDADGRPDAPLLDREWAGARLVVPAGGRFAWHLPPSTRPLALRREAWTLTCESADGRVLDRRRLAAGRGALLRVRLRCDRPQAPPALRAPGLNVPVPSGP